MRCKPEPSANFHQCRVERIRPCNAAGQNQKQEESRQDNHGKEILMYMQLLASCSLSSIAAFGIGKLRPIFKASSKCDSKSASGVESFMNESAVHLLLKRCQRGENKRKAGERHQSSLCGIGAESEARIRCHERGTISISQLAITA